MSPELELALDAATEAGKITLQYFRNRSLKVMTKRDQSPVTEADRKSEKKITSLIRSKFPKDGFLGEEFGESKSKNKRRWIIDPIDGTKSFIHGVPLYGVMIGFEIDSHLICGVVNFPALEEIFYAEKGFGAFCNTQRITSSLVKSLSESTLLTTSPEYLVQEGKHPINSLKHKAKLVRTWGDCYGHMLVANGNAELMIDPKMNPWDSAALVPIIEEAGGEWFDWEGKKTIYGKGFISTNQTLGKDILSMLNKKTR